jgi:FlaA1/EpsC-like NDP-sugar epimerase
MHFYNFISRLRSSSNFEKLILIICNDILISFFSVWTAFSLRLEVLYIPNSQSIFLFALAPILTITIFVIFKNYLNHIRYESYSSLLNLFSSISIYAVIFFCIILFLKIDNVPRSVGLIQPIVFSILAITSRMLIANLLKINLDLRNKRRIIIYGANDDGNNLLSIYKNDKKNKVFFFVDSSKEKHKRTINGIKILPDKKLIITIKKYQITDLLIVDEKIINDKKRLLVESLKDINIRIKFLPKLREQITGDLNYNDFENPTIDDLFSRNINFDSSKIFQSINNKNIVVSGAGGSIGSKLCETIIKFEPKLILLLDHSEYNLYKIFNSLKDTNSISTIIPILISIQDKDKIEKLFAKYNPHQIFHAAAYKHVELSEINFKEVIDNNFFGTISILDSAIKYGTEKFILVSTDKAVRPTSFMGLSKRLSEIYCQSIADKLRSDAGSNKTIISMVRFGNVFGSSGSVVPLFKNQILEKKIITVTHPDVTRYFMSIREAVCLILESSTMAKGGDVFILNMGKPIKIIDLARKMLKIYGKIEKDEINPDGDIEIKFTGLKQGEKLFEELLLDGDQRKTNNKDLFVANESFILYDQYSKFIIEMKNQFDNLDYSNVKNLLNKYNIQFNHNQK